MSVSHNFTHNTIPSWWLLDKYMLTFSSFPSQKGLWYSNSGGSLMWLSLYWLLMRVVPDHICWHTSLKAQSATFRAAPGCPPYRDFWWCVYYFEIKRVLHPAAQKCPLNRLVNPSLHFTWWRLLRTWVVSRYAIVNRGCSFWGWVADQTRS